MKANTNKKPAAFVVTRTGTIDNEIIKLVKETMGRSDINIRPVHSNRTCTTNNGLTTLLEQTQNVGKVFVVKGQIKDEALREATEGAIPFYFLYTNKEKKWNAIPFGRAKTAVGAAA